MKKRIIAIILATVLVAGWLGGFASAAVDIDSQESQPQGIAPVGADPTDTPDIEADAQVRDWAGYRDTNYGGYTYMWAGYDLDTGTYRSFVRFDLSSIPSTATINSASFNAYASSCPGSPIITVHRVTEPWEEGGVTWNNQPGVAGAATDSQQVTCGGWVSWDVTELVDDWLTGASANYGLSLRETELGGWAKFDTKETSNIPQLVVDYTLPDTTPPEVSISHSPLPPTSEQVVTFDATASDDSGLDWIEIYVGIAGEDPQLVDQCTELDGILEYTCSYTTLDPYPEGTVVTYRAKARDGANNVGWTGLQTFAVGPALDITPPQVIISHSPLPPTSEDVVTFNATASDASGLDWIRIYVGVAGEDPQLVDQCTELDGILEYTCSYTTLDPYPEGTVVTYRAEARDGALILGGTALQSFTVGPPADITPPEVSILVFPDIPPTSDDEVYFQVTAWDPSGIQWIKLYVDGVETACESSPCSYYGGPYPEGTVVIYRAEAQDGAGILGETDIQSFTVVAPLVITTPEVTIQYYRWVPPSYILGPAPRITTDHQILFLASASDPDGIERIEIFVNPPGPSIRVAECTGSGCQWIGGPYPEGDLDYFAMAWDTEGTSGTGGGRLQIMAPTCDDGLRNQGEEDVDCGGPCSPCGYIQISGYLTYEEGDPRTDMTPDELEANLSWISADQRRGPVDSHAGKSTYYGYGFKPIRLAKVGLRGGGYSADTRTHSNGYFEFVVPRRGGKEFYITVKAENYAARVEKDWDACNEYVWWESNRIVTPATGDMELGEFRVGISTDLTYQGNRLTGYWKERESPWYEAWVCGGDLHYLGGGSAYFNIAETILVGRTYANAHRQQNDGIGKVYVAFPDPSGVNNDTPWQNPVWDEIYLPPPSDGNDWTEYGFRDSTILHEYTHHLTEHLSENDWALADHERCWIVTEACYKGACVDLDASEFAWFEGFANYMRSFLCNRHSDRAGPRYLCQVGTEYGFMENPRGAEPDCPLTQRCEGGIMAVLWDLVDEDSAAESHFDTLSGYDVTIFEIFDDELEHVVDAPDLCEFAEAWTARFRGQPEESALNRILMEYDCTVYTEGC